MSYKIRFLRTLIFFLMFCSLISAEDITLNYPTNGDSCVISNPVNFSYTPNVPVNNCNLYTNNTGTWLLTDYNFSVANLSINYFRETLSVGTVLWGVQCSNTTETMSSSNNTFTYKAVLYCAVLSDTTCTSKPNLGNYGVVKTRLSNTRGVYLQNQDCEVHVTRDSDNTPIKVYDTMLNNAETDIQLDKDGNWINTGLKKAPLTDSQGLFIYSYYIDPTVYWMGDNYTMHVICNGQEAACSFQVDKSRLPDTENMQQLGYDASGVVALFFILAWLVLKYAGDVWKATISRVRG